MTSTITHQIIDEDEDDDGFDWEAAVREIDVACQTAKPSTSHADQFMSHFAPPDSNASCSKTKQKAGVSRQSTLDKFVAKAGPPRRQSQNRGADLRDQDGVEGDERVSCIDIDAEAAKTWIYPVNVPLRDYQFAITKKALFSNTLVALPTGLGKTLIAAVVMYNYFRWFPDGKIVFAAPSRPLVMQQIEACHNIVGIPQEWTIDMTGQINPTKRACFWKTKRVFFVTPQVLEKDIQSGTCLVNYLVLLVIDEAHRALGNYSYSVAVRELMAVPVQLRILALTATPGSKQQTIQLIIDNLYMSTLEYRNESDDDVSPYVHNRKVELIQVAMGQDAVEINNKLSEVLRPIVARLCAIGVLQNRDYQTLSPCELLNLRDKFRQAPPLDLPHIKYNEVEGYFGVLITLYHIRKLLSSHGIRPSYEMLEEKLQQGYFARFMSKNEDIWKTKLLMQQSLAHGAPSPKLSKMLEVLLDHFKTKDPRNSRVIIFSNFRGSVRDIMEALANITDLVRATQFIGQSSGKAGKALKGQSQKVQQAVLEKFRAGGYNVIVATSIGEEGLDIMEVDLVICFDANVSPLRMIQRMGRTGRKHDGRVVVLACEGSELKGYMRKQANSKAVRKHMRNGGMSSFKFHSSPRMIPHIYKPEVQFIELSIEQFVPRGKKVKDDHAIRASVLEDKLTVAETSLIAKYFHPNDANTWRPSLISFPHFQTFPSRVHKIMHAYRTGMLIDMMQCLQGLTFSGDCKTPVVEDEVFLEKSLVVNTAELHDNETKGLLVFDNSPNIRPQREVLGSEVSPRKILRTKEKHIVPDFCSENPPVHSYIFGSDYVSVDAFGKVLILSVPLLPLKEGSHSKCTIASSTKSLNSVKQDSCYLRTSAEGNKEIVTQAMAIVEITSPTRCIKDETLPTSGLCDSDVQTLDEVENNPETSPLKGNLSNEGDSAGETPDVVEIKASLPLADECSDDFRDIELSPRLTNLIKCGFVPESPVNDRGLPSGKKKDEFLVPDLVPPAQSPTELTVKSSSPGKNEQGFLEVCNYRRNGSVSPVNNAVQTPVLKLNNNVSITGCISTSPVVEEAQTPFANLTNNSCSKDWHLSSGDKSESVEQRRQFKRLRKIGDCGSRKMKSIKENLVVPIANLARSFSSTSPIQNKHVRGKKNPVKDARAFIEEEAEVSSDADISDDEEDQQDNSSYDSFIDDRINPTAASSPAESCRIDMMAIYRRSLLTQSPMERQHNCASTSSPNSVASMTRTCETASSSGKTLYSLQTPQTEFANQSAGRNSESFQMRRLSSQVVPCTTSVSPRGNHEMESRKRKLHFCRSESVPKINLEPEFLLQSETAAARDSFQHGDTNSDAKEDAFYDDQFYEGLDLDAVEAQATLLLKQKSEMPIREQEIIPQLHPPNSSLLSSPSFDLGI